MEKLPEAFNNLTLDEDEQQRMEYYQGKLEYLAVNEPFPNPEGQYNFFEQLILNCIKNQKPIEIKTQIVNI